MALGDVAAVAAEQLVAAVAGQHRAHVARGFARDQVQGDVGRARKRRVALDHGVFEGGDHVVRRKHDLVVVGAELLGDSRCARQLAVRIVGEAGGEGLEARAVLRRERDQRRGIDAAGKQHPGAFASDLDWSPTTSSVNAPTASATGCPVMRRAVGGRPVTHFAQPAELPQRVGARHQLAHAADQGARRGDVAIGEVIVHRAADRRARPRPAS